MLLLIAITASADYLKMAKDALNISKDASPVNTESKFFRFNSKNDAFIRYVDYEIPGFKTSEALIETAKIRRYIDFYTNESTFFYHNCR